MNLQSTIVNGLLRYGETAHMTGDLKAGKGWLLYDMALSAAIGGLWLDQFQYPQARVLIVEAKLHVETMAFRLDAIRKAKGGPLIEHATASCVRGKAVTLEMIQQRAENYDLVFVNGLDRILPSGMTYDEADAVIRGIAEETETGWIDSRWERSRTGGTHLHLQRDQASEGATLRVSESTEVSTDVPLTWRCPLWRSPAAVQSTR